MTKISTPVIRIITKLIKLKHSLQHPFCCFSSYISHCTANIAIYSCHLSFLSHPSLPLFLITLYCFSLPCITHIHTIILPSFPLIPYVQAITSSHAMHAFSLQHRKTLPYCLIPCICFSFPFFPLAPGSSASQILILLHNS